MVLILARPDFFDCQSIFHCKVCLNSIINSFKVDLKPNQSIISDGIIS